VPKVSEEYRDARREQIMAAARRCFLRNGFHATSMQDLFAEAGLSSGAVYRYFASKDELIVAIAEDNMRDVVATLRAIAAEGSDASVGDALAGVIDVINKKKDGGLGGIAVQVWAEALRNPAVAERFTKLLDELRADLATTVRTHQAAGTLPADVAPQSIANILTAIVAGHILQLALRGPRGVRGAADAARALWP
jgi:AcrR family transcriptional regulator